MEDYFSTTEETNTTTECSESNERYDTPFGTTIAVTPIEAIITIIVLSVIIVFTIIGNILVILSVFTYRPLRSVQNFFIISLAVADLMVAILVLPLNVASSVLGKWMFGKIICKLWLTSDVLCCTASILNLCAIALDRYWAITDPINYALKRTLKRVLYMIFWVWVLSLLISSPPLLGWNDWPEEFLEDTPCTLTKEKGYVIYSALGSFFIPLIIMVIVYFEIYIATRKRLRQRANQTKTLINSKAHETHMQESVHADNESGSSEVNVTVMETTKKDKKKNKKCKKGDPLLQPNNESTVEQGEGSSGSQKAVEPKPAAFRVDQFIEEKQRISLSKERRAFRTLGIIMGVFIICWLPFFLMYSVVPFCSSCCLSDKLTNFITWLGYVNSALNPIIYTIFNMDFRKAFKKLLRIQS